MSTAAGSTLAEAQTDLAPESRQHLRAGRPYSVVVWNDPVNLMSYVSWVFRAHFGHSRRKAHELMMQVHENGRAVVSQGDREQAERDVTAMHQYGLQSTLEES